MSPKENVLSLGAADFLGTVAVALHRSYYYDISVFLTKSIRLFINQPYYLLQRISIFLTLQNKNRMDPGKMGKKESSCC